jgi:hypothetical protein
MPVRDEIKASEVLPNETGAFAKFCRIEKLLHGNSSERAAVDARRHYRALKGTVPRREDLKMGSGERMPAYCRQPYSR